MRTIEKKIHPQFFKLVKSGKKKFELRLADFKIKKGDIFVMREWDPRKKKYTGRTIKKKVNHILYFKLNQFGQEREIKRKGLYVLQF
jgi:ASC-1-like (ASCH) protein